MTNRGIDRMDRLAYAGPVQANETERLRLMMRKVAVGLGSALIVAAAVVVATPIAVRKYAESKVDAALGQIGYQTTSMVRRGDVSVDVWSWTVSTTSVEIIGPGGENRTMIGRMTVEKPNDARGDLVADRMVLDDVKSTGPVETLTIPRAEIRGYAGPAKGLTATPGLGRNAETQADLFENVSIERIVAPVVLFEAKKTGLKRTIRNLVVNDMRGGVIKSATADAITLEAPYLPKNDAGETSSLLISTGAVRYDGLNLPTLWRFRDGDQRAEKHDLLKAVSIADIGVSLTQRSGGRFSASAAKLEVAAIELVPLAFAISAFDPVETGARFFSDATPQEVRQQLSYAVALLRSLSFDKVRLTDAKAQITAAGDPQTVATLASAEIGPYSNARVDSVKFGAASFERQDGLKATLGASHAYGFDATGLLAYADRVARDEVLLTTKPTAAEMLKIIPRLAAIDADTFDLTHPEGAMKVDRARIDVKAPLDAVPQNVTFRLDGLDASPPQKSEVQRWIETMELEGIKGSAKFSLTLDPDKDVLSLDWLDYGFEKLGSMTASGKLERVDPLLAVASGADFVDKFSAIRLAPFKLTLQDDGAADVLIRRAAEKAQETPEAYRETFARETEQTIGRLLGPPAEASGKAAADFIRDPRSAEITLAPRMRDQTLLDLMRAVELGPVGIAQVVDLQVLYKR